MNKRENINIELLRIIACYFVIVIHTWGAFRMDGGSFHVEVFVAGVTARVAVPVFFMITGYVYSNKTALRKKIQEICYSYPDTGCNDEFLLGYDVAPGIHYFVDETQEYITLAEYLKVIILAGGARLRDLYLCGHFWYIEELIKFYLLLPILQFILCDGERANKIRRFFLVIGFWVYFVTPVIERIWEMEIFNVYTPDGLLYIWYILFGFELSKCNWKHAGMVGLFGHWISIAVMSYLEYQLEYLKLGDIEHTFSTNSSLFILVSAVGLMMFVLNLKVPKRFYNGICMVGKGTLGIYIVHVFVYNVLYHLKITALLEYVPTVVFCVIYSTSVFLVSFVGIKIWDILLAGIKMGDLKKTSKD